MSPEVAPARRFKPVSLGIMFFSMGLALLKVGGLTTLSEFNKNINNCFMYFSFFMSGVCIVAFVACAAKREINDFISNKIKPWAYNIGAFYLFFFIINWLLNIPNNNTCIFRLVFYLGLIWFFILLVILISSLKSNIKFMASGIFIGVGIPFLNKYLSLVVSTIAGVSPLDSQDFLTFLFMWVIATVLFLIARRDCDLMEYFPI